MCGAIEQTVDLINDCMNLVYLQDSDRKPSEDDDEVLDLDDCGNEDMIDEDDVSTSFSSEYFFLSAKKFLFECQNKLWLIYNLI